MIFIPKKNIYFPQPRWGYPKFQRGSVSVTAFVNAAQQGTAGGDALNTTVTVDSGIYDSHATSVGSDDALAYGFGNASAANPLAVFIAGGDSMGNDTYTDGGSTSRTIDGIFWSDNGVSGTPAGETDNIYFGLVGTSIPDTDTTFFDFTYNGVNYVRSTRDTYLASEGTGNVSTYWVWLNVATNGPTSGTVDFDLTVT